MKATEKKAMKDEMKALARVPEDARKEEKDWRSLADRIEELIKTRSPRGPLVTKLRSEMSNLEADNANNGYEGIHDASLHENAGDDPPCQRCRWWTLLIKLEADD